MSETPPMTTNTRAYRGSLDIADYGLATKLSGDLVEHLGGVLDGPIPGAIITAWDEIQSGFGWTFDAGRYASADHWYRYDAYRAKDWPQVVAAVTQMASDCQWVDAG